MSTVVGARRAVGCTVGLAAIALLSYILEQTHHRRPLLLQGTLLFLDELALKEPADKARFFKSLPALLPKVRACDRSAAWRFRGDGLGLVARGRRESAYAQRSCAISPV